MIEVIPAIIAKDFKELKEKIFKVKPYSKWVQLDIMDGNFVPNTTWNKPNDFKATDFSIFFEAHLMISEPEQYINEWIKSRVKRIIIHIESINKDLINEVANKCHRSEVEFGIAINPETSRDILDPILGQIDLVLFLTIRPGFGGQKFLKEVLPKIKSFHQEHPNVKIEVDGGINPETGEKCVRAGADILVSGSYIFGSKDIKKAIEKLQFLK